MGSVMNMNSCEIEQSQREEEYGEEIMCCGWNPAVALVCQQLAPEPARSRMALPVHLATVDAESFLKKLYAGLR